jgi:hypothetical protein
MRQSVEIALSQAWKDDNHTNLRSPRWASRAKTLTADGFLILHSGLKSSAHLGLRRKILGGKEECLAFVTRWFLSECRLSL